MNDAGDRVDSGCLRSFPLAVQWFVSLNIVLGIADFVPVSLLPGSQNTYLTASLSIRDHLDVYFGKGPGSHLAFQAMQAPQALHAMQRHPLFDMIHVFHDYG